MSCLGGTQTYILACGAVIARELNDKNAVLGAEGNEQDYSYFGVYAHGNVYQPASCNGAEQGNGHAHYGGYGTCPALILRGKDKEGYKQGEAEDDCGVLARLLLLIGDTGPLVSELLAQL